MVVHKTNFMRALNYILPLMLLSSCSGGTSSDFSGVEIDLDLCDPKDSLSSWRGTWEGPAVSDANSLRGTVSLSVTQDKDCEISGAVVFQPCVPVTPIEGNGLSDLNVVTKDGSFMLTAPLAGKHIDYQVNFSYQFKNTQNRSNCPESDTGTAVLSRIN